MFESTLEADLAYILMADQRVADIWDQPPAIIYADPEGKKRRHTFDFLVRFKSGERIAIAVKPYSRVEPSNIRAVLRYILQQTRGKFADKFCICTEAEITRSLSHNSRLILRYRRMINEQHMDKMARLATNLNGSVLIGELAYLSGLKENALPAIVNLIDRGVLETSEGRIDHFSFVRLKDRTAVRLKKRSA